MVLLVALSKNGSQNVMGFVLLISASGVGFLVLLTGTKNWVRWAKSSGTMYLNTRSEEWGINWICRASLGWVKRKTKDDSGGLKVGCEDSGMLLVSFYAIQILRKSARTSTSGSWEQGGDLTPQADVRSRPSYWKSASILPRIPHAGLCDLFCGVSRIVYLTSHVYFPSQLCDALTFSLNGTRRHWDYENVAEVS